jgi:GDPmannose 4,6-dehydratase
MSKTAFITGVTGQDGSYLSEFLLDKGYMVYGLVRRSSLFNRSRIEHIINGKHSKNFRLIYGDLADSSSLNRFIEKYRPDEIYNLAAQSHVSISFITPEYTSDVNGLGALRILDAIREVGISTKFYQASSSEVFGKVLESPQKETTPFYPRSPYACAKAFAYYITQNYREAYNIFACNGILFNHESPRRGENFVTRKITLSLARIKLGLQKTLFLGNLNSKRDWGYAKDYIEAMWLMLQQDKSDDYVIATGETYSIKEFIDLAAPEFGFDIVWEGEGLDEKGVDKRTGKTIIKIDPKYFRPTEVEYLCGDSSKAQRILKWKPKTGLADLVKIMADSDIKAANIEKIIKENSYVSRNK